jgi:hypothetical protein
VKTSQQVLDLISGKGLTSARPSDPKIPVGIQTPSVLSAKQAIIEEPTMFEGAGISDQIMTVLEEELMDLDEELAMVVMMAEVEGLDPMSLAEAKCRPDWLDWQEAMVEELTALKKANTWTVVECNNPAL